MGWRRAVASPPVALVLVGEQPHGLRLGLLQGWGERGVPLDTHGILDEWRSPSRRLLRHRREPARVENAVEAGVASQP